MRKTIKYKRKGKRKTKGGKALRNPILSIPKNGIEMMYYDQDGLFDLEQRKVFY